MKTYTYLLLVCLCMNYVSAQFTELPSSKKLYSKKHFTEKKTKKNFFSKRVVPITLIASGILLSTTDFEKSLQKDIRGYAGDEFYLAIDDYTRYAPILEMYGADIFGVPSKNHWFDQTKNLVLSSLLANVTTTILKKEVPKRRPDNSSELNSFPSGHTSMAFVSATVLYEEFKDTSPILAHSGYLFAVTTAGLRMLNNKHYFSDVLVGAGIGTLATQLVYHFDTIIPWNPFKDYKNIAFAPQYDGESVSLYFTKQF